MKNFIFDLYNTLIEVRTDEHREETWLPVVKYFADRGIPVSDWKILERFFVEYWDEFNAQKSGKYAYPECDCVDQFVCIAKKAGGKLSRKKAAEALCIMRKASTETLRLFDGTLELFAELKKRGAKLYLLSNAQAAFTYDEIDSCGLKGAFDGMLLSSECGCRKPDPEFFGMLFDRFGLSKDRSVMVGDDRISDGKGAADFGIAYVYAGGGAVAVADELIRLAEEE